MAADFASRSSAVRAIVAAGAMLFAVVVSEAVCARVLLPAHAADVVVTQDDAPTRNKLAATSRTGFRNVVRK